MNDVKLVARICSLESFAARRPALSRFRVALIAAVGYAYLLLVVTLLLAMVVAILSIPGSTA